MANNTKTKKISFLFIIPTLNSYTKLPKLVNSLTNQIHKDWRCIFVDGNSTKKHKKWIKNLCDKDKRFVKINEDSSKRGIYNAMNKGYEFAKDKEWIIFLGSDDWFSSNQCLLNLSHNISENYKNEINLIISNADFINAKNKKVTRSQKVKLSKLVNQKNFYYYLLFGNMPFHQSICFSKKILEILMPYSNEFYLASDADLIIRLSMCKKLKNILFLNKKIINISTGGISSRYFLKRTYEVFKIYFRYYNYLFLMPFLIRYLKKLRLKLLSFF
tara:strand:- start:348 stop:1166 length:819 start_codon:yes stop_codon:yes gene_type:complete